jgi:hypothetical protein
MAALMLFAIESHSSSQRPCPNQFDEADGPIAQQVQSACHDTLPWLISISLVLHELGTASAGVTRVRPLTTLLI